MRTIRMGLCLALWALAVQVGRAADAPPPPMAMGGPPVPPGCQFTGFPKAGAKSPADLSGPLPVADYLDALFDCTDLRFNGAELYKPANAWLENDTKQYSALLARGKFSWLIVPAQTQYYGFDGIERSLLSAEIADAFVAHGAAPDPMLAARALGEIRRRYEPVAAPLLAQSIGATRMLETYVGHDGKRAMTLTLRLMDCSVGGTCRLLKQHDWRALPFTDEKPPFLVVRGMRDALVGEMLGMKANAARPVAPRPKRAGTDLSALGTAPTDAEPALVSGVLAALMPGDDETGRDRLSVLALRDALNATPSNANRVRAAAAAFRLNRRPYALALLQGLNDPAAVTLRELLNGNLPEAQTGLASVEPADLKLILAFAVQDLRSRYDRPADFDPAAAARLFGANDSPWSGVVFRRAGDLDNWSRADAVTPKRLLDAAFPVAGQDLASVLKGMRVVGRNADPDIALTLASLRHLRQAQGRLSPADCCSANRANSAWPIYWLAESLLQSNAIKATAFQLLTQGEPEEAKRLLGIYQEFYAGQPYFEVLRFRIDAELASRASNEMASRLMAEAEAAEKSAAYWSQGQTYSGQLSALRGTATMIPRMAYTQDFPPRAAWPPLDATPGPSSWACDVLRYATVDVMAASFCLMAAPPGRADALRADVAARFHGNAQAAAMLRPYLPRAANADPVAEFRTAIAGDPESWDNYRDLGLLLLKRDANYPEAQKVYLSYPEFKRTRHAYPVRVSNDAYDVGSELFWRGQYELARPLYELAANLDTGSNASMSSAIRLALIDGDYATAMAGSRERGQRYPNPYAFRDYLSLLHVLGRGDEARAGFAQISGAFDDPSAWVAELVGQRMQAQTADQFKAWILSDPIRQARYRGRHYAPIYALWWMTTDRKPGADFAALMRKIEADERRTVEYDGISMGRPHPKMEGGLEIVRPSQFRGPKAPKLPPESNGPSEYVLLADALAAHYAGDYAAAVTKFGALADRYPIEEGDTMVALGYFAYDAAKTGDKVGLEEFIGLIPNDSQYFDVWLARAHFAAVRHDADKSYQALLRAFNVRPYTESRPVMTEYQFAEACETVLKETGDARVAAMLLDWAKRWQRIHPTSSWAYAVEANYSKNPADVTRALALALYLDPSSPRLARFDAAKQAAARAWLKANNPFLGRRPRSAPPSGV
ncbi:MAG TPA: hypothetical protein VMF52_03650 [Steroidobacteraceae bacterium]|nr:hypothetical protein [Steroidobacteraceae bacterium]